MWPFKWTWGLRGSCHIGALDPEFIESLQYMSVLPKSLSSSEKSEQWLQFFHLLLIPLLDIGSISFRVSGNSLICCVGALCNSCIWPLVRNKHLAIYRSVGLPKSSPSSIFRKYLDKGSSLGIEINFTTHMSFRSRWHVNGVWHNNTVTSNMSPAPNSEIWFPVNFHNLWF